MKNTNKANIKTWSLNELHQACHQLSKAMQRDEKQFNSYGISTDRISGFSRYVNGIEQFTDQKSFQAQRDYKFQQKQQAVVELSRKMIDLLEVLKLAWPDNHPLAVLHQVGNLTNLSDYELLHKSRILLLHAHNYLDELELFGFNEEQLIDFSDYIVRLAQQINEYDSEIQRLENQSHLIIDKADLLFRKAQIYSKIGQAIWHKKSRSKMAAYALAIGRAPDSRRERINLPRFDPYAAGS